MITTEQIQEFVSALRSHTESAVRVNQRSHLPFIYTGKVTSRVLVEEPDADLNDDTLYDEDTVVEEEDSRNYWWNFNNIVAMKKFHYNDKYYSHIYSADEPERSYGIVRVDHMPYHTFEPIRNKKSFITRLDRLIYDDLCEPIMIFVNRKFVNWYNIDVVYDAGTTYLLLHGSDYNWFNLSHSELHMVVLPFKCDFIGEEEEWLWQLYYDVLCQALQDSLTVNANGNISIQVPSVGSTYETRGTIFALGAWLFTQLRMDYLGLLSEDRTNKLKKISLTKYEYDQSGNVTSTYITRFNALDRDSYDIDEYLKVCHMPYEMYEELALFRFDSDGTMNQTDGCNIIALMDESLYTNYFTSSESCVYNAQDSLNNVLFRENYMVWKDGLLYPECEIKTTAMNTMRIDNEDKNKIEVFTFLPNGIENVITISDPFKGSYLTSLMLQFIQDIQTFNIISYDYSESMIQDLLLRIEELNDDSSQLKFHTLDGPITLAYEDAEKILMLTYCMESLNYVFGTDKLYEENIQNGWETILKFDPQLTNGLYHTETYSHTVTGAEANESLTIDLGTENRRGLKIPRMKYKDHETYVMVFCNGELLETYYRTIAFPNFFFIPLPDESFNDSDEIELLFFTYVDNNEIHFETTENMFETCFTDDDGIGFKTNIFDTYIREEDLKIFCDYPDRIMEYLDLIDPSDDIAFNVSYRNGDDLYVYKDVLTYTPDLSEGVEDLDDLLAVVPDSGVIPTSEEQIAEHKTYEEVDEDNWIIGAITTAEEISGGIRTNEYTAVSTRKFIYQRLYVNYKSYRIKISGRFRYCDNQNQYMLFINGRRIEQEGFLITIPKHSRPFWGMYLYTAKFVGPEDRIELFYVPCEVMNENTETTPVTFESNGYIEAVRQNLKVPYDPRLYMFFVNGKKIAASDLQTIDTHTLRVRKDQKSLLHLVINKLYRDTLDDVITYLQGDTYSTYDYFIDQIKNISYLSYDELDNLFNIHTLMTDSEEDMILWDVGPIAIINEIVRDFWVTSGYPYNDNVKFVYDYARDEYLVEANDGEFLDIPSLNASPYINIIKDELHLLYFYGVPEEYIREIGSTLDGVNLYWEYSDPIYGKLNMLHQYINDIEIDQDLRTYFDDREITEDITYTLEGIFSSGYLTGTVSYHFYNGVYYGNVDEDSLQWWVNTKSSYSISDLMALVRKDGKMPTSDQLQNGVTMDYINMYYNIITNIIVVDDELYLETNPDEPNWGLDELVNVEDPELYAICIDGEILTDIIIVNATREEDNAVYEYYGTAADMQHLVSTLNYSLQDTVSMNLDDYIIGNNNYFVFAAPTRLCYDNNGDLQVEFLMPDISEIVNLDDKTTPLYTDGTLDENKQLRKLTECHMIHIGTFDYTNAYDYTESYEIWMSNGYFTRNFENYKFNITIRNTREVTEQLPYIFTDETAIENQTGLIIDDYATSDTAFKATFTRVSADESETVYDDAELEIIFLDGFTFVDK